ncbi:MAG: hypothetical protein ABS888_00205 [Eubacteriales bacterium]
MATIRQILGLEAKTTDTEVSILRRQVEGLEDNLLESFAQLELAKDQQGWALLGGNNGAEHFTTEGLKRAALMGRVMGVANPLIKRGRELRYVYVWGQGVEVSARDEVVNEVVQAYITDEGNREAFFGAQARMELEGTLFDEGNVFLAHFTDPLTGRVRVRTIPFSEIDDVVTAPGDRATPHYYLRTWTERGADGKPVTMQAYYPALKYQPATRFKAYDGKPVIWDAPIRHIKVNTISGGKFGVADSYAAQPWAIAHKGFLEDWSLLMKALAKIAYVTSSDKPGSAQAKRQALRGMENAPAGSTVSMSADQKLEPMSKSGATLDAESSRPLATMAASAMGVPVTLLLADPGQTGARATAETLDLPTRLVMGARRELHAEVMRDSIGYALEQAVIAPRGALRRLGRAVRDGDRLGVEFTNRDDATLEIVWPSLEETNLKEDMEAIVAADGMPGIPRLPLIKLALQRLGVEDVDELIQKITDDDGNLIDTDASAGDAAVRAFRAGQDPAEAL